MKLIFIRHGETDFNATHKTMGQRMDFSLNEKGVEQAKEIFNKLPKDFKHLFSSPLKRAYETAKMIAKQFDKEIIIRNELAERDYGELSGKTWDEIKKIAGEELKVLDRTLKYDYRKYEGESVEDVEKRVKAFVDEVKTNYKDSKVVVVSHGGIIRIMHKLFGNKEVHEMENVSIHEFDL